MTQARIAQLARGLQLIHNETEGEDVRSPRVIVDMPNQAYRELADIVGEAHPRDMVKTLLNEAINALNEGHSSPHCPECVTPHL